MGNRAVITTEDKQMGVYVHWNGGRNFIDGFLAYCKAMKYRSPKDDSYGWARLCQTIANFFGPDGLSVGVDKYENLDTDNGDNGVYVISDWKVVQRLYNRNEDETPTPPDNLIEIMMAIRDEQPEHSQLGDDEIIGAAKNYFAQYVDEKQLPSGKESEALPGESDEFSDSYFEFGDD